jgi:putative ABC transport system permease protein
MRLLSRARSLWNTLRHKDRLDRELDDELRAAIETLAARHVANGMDPKSARRTAIRTLAGPGGLEEVRDSIRDNRIGAALDALLLDVRYAARGLRQAPGFAAIVTITLALGIGANTAIFSVVHAMLLEPLPYRDADRLAFIWLDRTATSATLSGLGYPRGPMSGPDIQNLRDGTRSFSGIAGIWASGTIALVENGEPEQLRGALVTTNFFDVLGAAPALGRAVRADDSANGAEPAILLGWDLFERRFGGDRTLIGRTIDINGNATRVVGVMPKGFRLLLPPDASTPDDLQAFAPFWPDMEKGPRRNLFLRVIARMHPGVTIEQARDDVTAMSRTLSRELGAQRAFTTVALHADDVREIRAPLLALFAGVSILLMIACVNVAGLLIARAASRTRETALRLALGATRNRLVRQSLVEGLLLTCVGGLGGILAGYVGLRALVAITPDTLSRLRVAQIDPIVLAFTAGISVVWGVVLSLAPLTHVFRADMFRSLSSARGHTSPVRYRTRAGLVAGQIALSVVLSICATLLLRAFVKVLAVDPGFRTERRLTFRTLVPRETFVRELTDRVSALPGVTGVGAFSHLPYDDLPNWGLPYSLTSPIAADAPTADARAISPGLMETLGVRLIDGRFFTVHDRDPEHPVVIVDEKFANLMWPGRRAVGQQFFTNVGSSRKPTVVGVVRHLRLRSLVDDLLPQMYVPWQLAQRNPMAFVVGTSGNPALLAQPVREAVAALDRRLAIYDVRPMRDYVESARGTRRFTVMLAGTFAVTALLLTCVGVYGVLAYAVAHRRHEFGVRRALGADTARVMREVLREGMACAAAGCVAGGAAALAAGRLLQGQLYGVHPRDPLAYLVAIGIILGGAVAACAIPAYRAATISPMDALRGEQ